MPTPQLKINPWLALNNNGASFLDPYGDGSSVQVFNQPQIPVPQAPTQQMQQPSPQLMPVESSVKTMTTTETPIYQTPEVQDILARIRERGGESRQGQLEGIRNLESTIQQHLARQKASEGFAGLDLTPLAALTDTWTGSKLAQSYSKPQDSKAYLETTARLQDALQRAKGALSQTDIDNLKAELNSILRSKETEQQAMESKARTELSKANTQYTRGLASEKEDIRARENFNKEFGEPIMKTGDFVSASRDVRDILKSNGYKVPAVTSPEYAKYQSAVSRMITRYNADIAKLGALAGADLKLLSGATVTTPDMFQTWVQERMRGDAKSTVEVLDALEAGLDKQVKNMGVRAKDIWGNRVADQYKNVYDIYNKQKSGVYGETSAQNTNKPSKIIQDGYEYTLNPTTGEYE